MPEPTTGYLITVVLVSAAVTRTLRAAPFALLAPLRRSALVPYLNEAIPVGVIIILVANSLLSSASASPAVQPWVPLVIATAATVTVHLWRRNFLLSIVVGTGLYVTLVSTVFAP